MLEEVEIKASAEVVVVSLAVDVVEPMVEPMVDSGGDVEVETETADTIMAVTDDNPSVLNSVFMPLNVRLAEIEMASCAVATEMLKSTCMPASRCLRAECEVMLVIVTCHAKSSHLNHKATALVQKSGFSVTLYQQFVT